MTFSVHISSTVLWLSSGHISSRALWLFSGHINLSIYPKKKQSIMAFSLHISSRVLWLFFYPGLASCWLISRYAAAEQLWLQTTEKITMTVREGHGLKEAQLRVTLKPPSPPYSRDACGFSWGPQFNPHARGRSQFS